MSCVSLRPNRIDDGNLAQAIEPLASYICAAERPKAALLTALAVLRREVAATNRVAVAHFGAFLEDRWS